MLNNSTLKYLSKPYHNLDIVPIKENQEYGICAIHCGKENPLEEPILFHFMIDVSGSMSDFTEKGRTKMQLLIHTLSNMIRYLGENHQHVALIVKGFDNQIHDYVPKTEITKENVSQIISKLNGILPMQSTDIGIALDEMHKNMESEKEIRQVGIFLTDGEITQGETDTTTLVSKLPSEIPFHFIALGYEHNERLMYSLGHASNYTFNWFINQLEQTGNIYGEILYNELHKVWENVYLEIEHGHLFDYYLQEFVTRLPIKNVSGESEKHFHLITNDKDICKVTLHGWNLVTQTNELVPITDLPPLIPQDQINTVYYLHCAPYFMEIQFCRLITQMYMGKVRKNLFTDSLEENVLEKTIFNKKSMFYEEKRKALFDKIKIFSNFLEEYAKIHDLESNEFFNTLKDDITILLQTLFTHNLLKYCGLREDNQGQQRISNAVVDIPKEHISTNGLSRPILQRSTTTPYRTPGRVNIMDSLSQDADDYPSPLNLNDIDDDNTGTLPPPILRHSASSHN